MQRKGDQAGTAEAGRIALAALIFIAEDPDRIGGFLAATGAAPEALRSSVQDPRFLSSILDHVMSQEELAAAFARSEGLSPEQLARASYVLSNT